MLTLVFIVLSLVTLIASLASSLLSQKAITLQHHMIGLGRLGVFASVAYSLAQVLQTGETPEWESVLMVASLASIYVAQIRCEVIRQRLRRRSPR